MAAIPGAATYSGDPSLSDKDKVRSLIPDSRAPFEFTDKELEAMIAELCDPLVVAIEACEILAGKYANAVDKKIGSLSISGSQKSENWRKRASSLRKSLSTSGKVKIFAGGQSISDKDGLARDTDAVQPHTEVGQDDFPGEGDNRNPYHRHNH